MHSQVEREHLINKVRVCVLNSFLVPNFGPESEGGRVHHPLLMRSYTVVFSPKLLPIQVHIIIRMRQHERKVRKGGVFVKCCLLKRLNDDGHLVGAGLNSVDAVVSQD